MNLTTSKLKKIFMKCFYESKEIVRLIDDKKIEYPDDLLGTHIFPVLKLDYTEQEMGSYICIAVDYPSICKNIVNKNYILTVLLISHNGHSITSTGDCRTDLLSEEVIKLLNWKDDIGFRLELISDKEYVLDKSHHARELIFDSIVSNSMINGVKQN